eukprot:CAMPEP_0194163560 /NCGR_PEP_ID=MMETSP0152-20130528/80108_1 /TAXON_ID=1049557 /ORGANISM="Thalassiothrix antarctica, Strain L6-D1" /LENGTH=176 /DNA_ID=CAMNT_0038873563 /DNA_START=712 /DNA_END=1242 /DNA_ORIENTATION=+
MNRLSITEKLITRLLLSVSRRKNRRHHHDAIPGEEEGEEEYCCEEDGIRKSTSSTKEDYYSSSSSIISKTTTTPPSLPRLLHPNTPIESSIIVDQDKNKKRTIINFSLTIQYGRPLLDNLVQPAIEAKCPGIFQCGPDILLQDVKKRVKKGRGKVSKCCSIGGEESCCFYEESFEM